eukprot:Pgem_evm1s19386
MHCPGHCGHIDLALPVYNPILFTTLFTTLRSSCFYCHQFKAGREDVHELYSQLELAQYGLLKEAGQLPLESLNYFPTEQAEAREKDDEVGYRIRCINNYVMDVLAENGITKKNRSAKYTKTTHSNAMKQELSLQFFKKFSNAKKCKNCNGINRSVRKDKASKMFLEPLTETDRKAMLNHSSLNNIVQSDEANQILNVQESINQRSKTFLTALNLKLLLEKVWANERLLVNVLYCAKGFKNRKTSSSMFFIDCLPVPPSRFRPASVMGDKIFENAHNTHLKNILVLNNTLLKLRYDKTKKKDDDESNSENDSAVASEDENEDGDTYSKGKDAESFLTVWGQLQDGVNTMIDSNLSKSGGKVSSGIKQILEKKEGLFRMHMMGKRVNYACRS